MNDKSEVAPSAVSHEPLHSIWIWEDPVTKGRFMYPTSLVDRDGNVIIESGEYSMCISNDYANIIANALVYRKSIIEAIDVLENDANNGQKALDLLKTIITNEEEIRGTDTH